MQIDARSLSQRVGVGSLLVVCCFLAACGAAADEKPQSGACPALAEMAGIGGNAEREFNAGTRTLAEQLEDFDRLDPVIERVVTECTDEAAEQGFMLGAKFGAITNALSGQ